MKPHLLPHSHAMVLLGNTPLHSTHQVGVQCLAPCFVFLFPPPAAEPSLPRIDRELPMMQTCVTVSAYVSILALLSVNRCPLARHIPADAVGAHRRRGGGGGEGRLELVQRFSVAMNEHMSGKQRTAHTALRTALTRTFRNS